VGVKAKNWSEWAFVSTLPVSHVANPSPGEAAVAALFGAIRPKVWVSDMGAASAAMACGGRCAWRICSGTRDTPSNDPRIKPVGTDGIQSTGSQVAAAGHRDWTAGRDADRRHSDAGPP
jgi:hypothetical protein